MNPTTITFRKTRAFIVILNLGLAIFFWNSNSKAQSVGTFVPTGSLPFSERNAVALLLPSDLVLITGGIDSSSRLLSLVEYDPSAETFSNIGSMDAAYDTATLLNDGNVLLAGGGNFVSPGSGNDVLTTAELYNPATGGLIDTGPALQGVVAPAAVRLLDGRVLLTGGKLYNQGGAPATAAETYDPASGTFSFTGNMTTPRYNHSATLLEDGDVLIAGGSSSSVTDVPLATAELYDPTRATFTAVAKMNSAHASHTATLLADGKVLIAGGAGQPPIVSNSITAVAEIYDPSSGTFAITGAMRTPREFHQATRLSNGQVIVTGGDDSFKVLANTEIYDPTSGTFAADGSMAVPRDSFTATLLNNGDVLLAGGLIGFTEAADTPTAELYVP